MIRDVMVINDAARICEIYNFYVKNTIITFEESVATVEEMAVRISDTQKAGLPWLVCVADDDNKLITGFAYASKWKSRCAYKHSLETTIYLDKKYQGQGNGKLLYSELINRIKTLGYHAAIGGIALPNEASIALHEKLGYEKIGQFKEVGFKFGKWIDVGYWEIVFKNSNKKNNHDE